jgi:hypothetical protein
LPRQWATLPNQVGKAKSTQSSGGGLTTIGSQSPNIKEYKIKVEVNTKDYEVFEKLFQHLSEELGITQSTLRRFFQILQQQQVLVRRHHR